MPVGRPAGEKYKPAHMIKKIDEYIEKTSKGLPILKECCLLNNWDYDYVMKLQRNDDELRQSIKRLLYQKEVNLEKGALKGTFSTTMAIFSLKQLGWRDQLEVEASGTIETLVDLVIKNEKEKKEKEEKQDRKGIKKKG